MRHSGRDVHEPAPSLYPELAAYLGPVRAELDTIPEDRRQSLGQLARFIREQPGAGAPARLVFICTHNSRRSQLAQIWAQTAAHYFGVAGVEAYSGGIEATAFNPRAVAALRRVGFLIEGPAVSDNPIYRVRFAEPAAPIEYYSKAYLDEPNPRQDFAAVMTCSHADQSCPLVPGAVERIAIPYQDPKGSDGTDQEAAVYDERCRQIARELLYAFSLVDR